MIIFLGIIGEIATVIGSIAITINAVSDSVLEIPKNGYKIDKKRLDEVQKKQAEEKKQKANLSSRVLRTILLLVPGVNLIKSNIEAAKLKKSVINDPQIQEFIVPMTEKEKKQYAKMKSKLQKLTFTTFISDKEKEKEFCGFIGKRPIVVDHGLTTLHYEKLMPLDYTLDEVKRLNEATTYSYRIGKIDGKNVAVIGIPNPDSTLSRVHFKAEDYKVTYTYEKMTEEEAQDKTFTVYPFTIRDDTQANVEKVVQEIKQFRIDNATKASVEALEVQPRFEQETIHTKTETILSEEQQGPRLVKTMNASTKRKR